MKLLELDFPGGKYLEKSDYSDRWLMDFIQNGKGHETKLRAPESF